MSDHSPTLGFLSRKLNARFNFQCKPCNRFEAIEAGEMMAIHGEAMTLANLTRRIRCKRCRMPVDGDFRTLQFYSIDRLDGFGYRVD